MFLQVRFTVFGIIWHVTSALKERAKFAFTHISSALLCIIMAAVKL